MKLTLYAHNLIIALLSAHLTQTPALVPEVGCPPGRLYRECERGEGCPFSCAQVSGQEGCYSEGCEEGCHCPLHTFQHNRACVQVSYSGYFMSISDE